MTSLLIPVPAQHRLQAKVNHVRMRCNARAAAVLSPQEYQEFALKGVVEALAQLTPTQLANLSYEARLEWYRAALRKVRRERPRVVSAATWTTPRLPCAWRVDALAR